MFVLSPLSPYSTVARRGSAPQLSRVFDRLFDDSLDRVFGRAGSAARTPALDVSETDAVYTVSFDLPGVSREQVKVSVEGRRVSLETVDAPQAASQAGSDVDADAAANAVAEPAAVAEQAKPSPARVLYRERATTRYARTVSLPAEVDQSASQARFENGVLTLTLAKKVPAGATQLSIG